MLFIFYFTVTDRLMRFTPFTLIFSVDFPFLMPFTFKLEVLEEEMILALLEFVYLLFINLALPRILILAHLPLLTTIFVLLNFGDVVTVNTQLLLKPFLLIAVIVVLPFVSYNNTLFIDFCNFCV